MGETRIVAGQVVELAPNGCWYFEGAGTTPGTPGARDVGDGEWHLMGTGVAVPR